MTEPIILTDDNLDETLSSNKPVLLLITNGEGLRGDFNTAFKKAANENPNVTVARLDPSKNPKAAAHFEVGSKPVMVALNCGEVLVRRNRPWGTDVPLALDLIKQHVTATQGPIENQQEGESAPKEKAVKEQNIVLDKPVAVTDETFQTEVIDSELPVLIDFWAEWCGPCRMVAPSLDKLAKEFAGQVKIAKVNVDENPGLSQTFRIMSIPNMMAIKNRTMVFNQPGALPEAALRDLIQQLIKLEVPDPETAKAQAEESAE